MTKIADRLNLDELDLAHVARILKKFYPVLSLCDCARMAAQHAPEEGCTCSLCGPERFPGCLQDKRDERPPATP